LRNLDSNIRVLRHLIAILIFVSVPARADLVDDAVSPVNTDAKWILLTGTALTVIAVAERDQLEPWEKWTATNRPLGKYSKYGDNLGQLLPNAVYTVGMWGASYLGAERGKSLAWEMVEVSAYASLWSTILKYNVSEGRPYDEGVHSSFPSGHATTAFAFAGVIAAEHGWYWGVPAMAMATFVGYSRINDNQHRTHDVIAGATIGLTAAYGIHYSHQKNGSQVQLMPVTIPGGGELLASWSY
jgi:hypothetical protein